MILLWLPVLAWMGFIFYLSGIPNLNSGLGVWDFVLRKCAHVFMFTVLTALLIRAIRNTWFNFTVRQVGKLAVLVSFLYAISDEIHQLYVPGRACSAMDVAIDSIGIVFCAILWVKADGHFRLKKL